MNPIQQILRLVTPAAFRFNARPPFSVIAQTPALEPATNRIQVTRLAMLISCALALGFATPVALAKPGTGATKFAQLEPILPTPNVYRTASGAPGPQYWQQRADYKVQVQLDEVNRTITGSEVINYTNNSPDTLRYIWIQLDQNRFADNSIDRLTETRSRDRVSFGDLRELQSFEDHEYGHNITRVEDTKGNPLQHVINGTMMRIDLPKPLDSGDRFSFEIDWQFAILEEVAVGSRSGYEHFPDNDTYIYFLAQWFPRLAAYTDYTGWQNKQFIGRGEFTLEFGDYEVEITVPADHIVSATGALTNPKEVLTAEQRSRLDRANSQEQVFIVTQEEALENEKSGTLDTKTWRFKADNVRDFAFSSSRKFIWDVLLHEQPGATYDKVLAMSFYPIEAEPIWSQYSSHAVAHTMDVYSRYSFDYPYPTAQSVNTWASGGMEYPMISFNGYRPAKPDDDDDSDNEDTSDKQSDQQQTKNVESKDKEEEEPTYARHVKYGLVGVIIHEIGHIYFPMIVNSDERRWTWMDEGLNSFLEYIAELEWEESYPTHSNYTNVLDYIPTYMTSQHQVPIMTDSESILQFGPNAYTKPTAALVVLRETVMGRELFDFAFREYANRWKFKRPTPADFFRTMEDASAVDLDWFWRGWFYTTDHVDLAVTDIRHYKLGTKNPDIDNEVKRQQWHRDHPAPISETRNRSEGKKMRINEFAGLRDLYNDNDQFTVSNKDRNRYQSFIDGLKDWEKAALDRAIEDDHNIYFVDFENLGGLVSPLPLTVTYTDNSSRSFMVPAEVWRRDADKVTQLFVEEKLIQNISIDNAHQTADADYSNNQFPRLIQPSQLDIYKRKKSSRRNLMKDLLVELKKEKSEEQTVPLESSGN